MHHRFQYAAVFTKYAGKEVLGMKGAGKILLFCSIYSIIIQNSNRNHGNLPVQVLENSMIGTSFAGLSIGWDGLFEKCWVLRFAGVFVNGVCKASIKKRDIKPWKGDTYALFQQTPGTGQRPPLQKTKYSEVGQNPWRVQFAALPAVLHDRDGILQ